MKLLFEVVVNGKEVPEFLKGLGKGVLLRQEVDIPDNQEDMLVGAWIASHKDELIEQVITVNCKQIKDESE